MGSCTKEGNTTPWAEFNFHCDALAAHVVLKHFCENTQVNIVPWEPCLTNVITFKQFHSLFDKNNPVSTLLHSTGMTPWLKDQEASGADEYIFADQFVAMILLYPESSTVSQRYRAARVNWLLGNVVAR